MERFIVKEEEFIDNTDSTASQKSEVIIPSTNPNRLDQAEQISVDIKATLDLQKEKDDRIKNKKSLEGQYIQTQEAIAKFQTRLLDAIKNNPNFLAKTNDEIFEELGIPEVIPEEERLKIISVLNRCWITINNIDEAFSQNPDPQDMYEYAFGVRPEGKVEVQRGPLSIYFRCFNIIDYAWIDSQAFLKDGLTEADVVAANQSGGVSIASAVPEGLKGVIIAENVNKKNKEWQAVKKHEEEHTIRRIIDKELHKSPKISKIPKDLLDQLILLKEKNPGKHLRDIMPEDIAVLYANVLAKDHALSNSRRGADEILAYFKDGIHTAKETYYILTRPESSGGLYDYFVDSSIFIKKWFQTDNPEILKAVDDACDKERKKYEKALLEGLHAVLYIYGTGKYSRDEVIAMLDKEPLQKWPKISQRIAGRKLKA